MLSTVRPRPAAFLILVPVAYGQHPGNVTAESHPQLLTQRCTTSGGCTTENTAVVLDSDWRWLHSTSDYTNCYTDNTWDLILCPDPIICAQNCALDGADYSGTYGITTSSNTLTLRFMHDSIRNVGSRVYLMSNESTYEILKLKNQEFTFDVDMSSLPCGVSGTVSLSEMAADGGMSQFPTNKAGAKYGTGYCNAQCSQDIRFINGQANLIGWTATSSTSGTGSFGSCCNEMDIWQANSISAAFTPHTCSVVGQTRCSGSACGDGGFCDKDGCDFNSFRMGNSTFLGKGMTVDTSRKFTVVTQFITSDNTANGDLIAIRRLYIQNGVVIQNSLSNIAGVGSTNTITYNFCAQQKTAFDDTNYFAALGGLKTAGDALGRGMVLALSIRDDPATNLLWLDSDYPAGQPTTDPGVARGTCSTGTVTIGFPDPKSFASVVFSNIKFGDIGSTFGQTNGTVSPSSSLTSTASSPTSTAPVPQWGQCGGIDYNGSTTCVTGFTCHVSNPYFSQCY